MPTAKRAYDFVHSIGVNVHMTWGGSWESMDRIMAAMRACGALYVRASVPYEGWTLPRYERMNSELGIRFCIIPDRDEFLRTDRTFKSTFDHVASLMRSRPGAVFCIEGFNEVNNSHWSINVNGCGETAANLRCGGVLQKQMWDQHLSYGEPVRSAKIANLTVASISPEQALAGLGDCSSLCDFGTWHTYFNNGEQPRPMLINGINGARGTAPNRPPILTETGYHTSDVASTAAEWGSGGDFPTQAKLMSSLVLAAFELGIRQSYIYMLMDNDLHSTKNSPSGDMETSFGICWGDGTPKPAATAIKRLIDALKDTGAQAQTFALGSLDYTVSGLPADGHHMLLQKSDGSYHVALWREARVWDAGSRRPINNAPANVTVTFQKAASTIVRTAILDGGSANSANASSVQFSLGDNPVIVSAWGLASGGSVSPPIPTPTTPPTPTPATPPPPPVLGKRTKTIGTGSGALLLKISQDAWREAAKYNVSINGVQVGGPLEAGAVRGSGETDELTILGTWQPGTIYSVGINFINDAFGGVPGTDRNLYLEGATLNGIALPSSTLTFLSGGVQSFQFVGSTATAPTPPPPAPPANSAAVVAALDAAESMAKALKASAASTVIMADVLLAKIASAR